MLYQMVVLPMTLGDPNSQTTRIFFTFFVAFHIFVVSEHTHRDFKFGTHIYRS